MIQVMVKPCRRSGTKPPFDLDYLALAFYLVAGGTAGMARYFTVCSPNQRFNQIWSTFAHDK